MSNLTALQAASIVREDNAQFLRRQDFPNNSGSILTRFWPEIARTDLDACMAYLSTAASVVNPQTRPTLTTHVGTWNRGYLYYDYGKADPTLSSASDKLNLYQVLVLAGSTLDWTLIEDSCRFKVYLRVFYSLTAPAAVTGHTVAGIRYEQDVRFDPNTGTYQVTERRIERQEQTATYVAEASPAGTVTAKLELGRPDDPDALASTTGSVKTRTLEIEDDCSRNVRTLTETPADQGGTGSEADFYRTVARLTQTEGTALAAASYSLGTVKRRSSQPTKAGNFQTLEETETPTSREWTFNFASNLGTITIYMGRNVTDAEYAATVATAALTSATRNSQDKRFTPAGRIDYEIIKSPVDGGANSDTDYDTIGEFLFPMYSADGAREYCVAVLYTTNKTIAQAYAQGIEATKTYGEIADVNGATVSGAKTSWSSSVVVTNAGAWSTGAWRNRNTGRWTAVRVQKKTA